MPRNLVHRALLVETSVSKRTERSYLQARVLTRRCHHEYRNNR
jgi:hypothetical protein